MGKTKRSDRELDQLQRMKSENEQLKRQISSLRKQMARLDVDRFSNVKDILEETYSYENVQESQNALDRLKKEWLCKICSIGHLEIFTYTKLGNPWYFRTCSNSKCSHRTKSQAYSANVKGIMKPNE